MAENKNWIPGPKYLIDNRHLDNQVGLHERNFGFGEKLDLSMPANNYPGAKYIIPGFTVRFHKLAKKLEKSLVEEVKVQEWATNHKREEFEVSGKETKTVWLVFIFILTESRKCWVNEVG